MGMASISLENEEWTEIFDRNAPIVTFGMSRYGQVMDKDWHYTTEFGESLRLKTGTCVGVRAILPSDKTRLAHFHEILSEATVYQRYFSVISLGRRIDPGELARVCSVTCREFALVATLKSQTSWEQIIALAQVVRQDKPDEAECALVVRDHFHNQGLGTHMCRRLLDISRASGIRRIVSLVLDENFAMRRVLRKLGFTLEWRLGGNALWATLDLDKKGSA